MPTTTVASHTHSVTVATTSQTHPSQIEIPSRIDQVILFVAARPRIFPLFDRPQPFQKLALSPFLQNGPQDRPQRDQGGHSCYWRDDRRVRVRSRSQEGMKVGRSMGTTFRYRYGRDEAGGSHGRAKAIRGGGKRIQRRWAELCCSVIVRCMRVCVHVCVWTRIKRNGNLDNRIRKLENDMDQKMEVGEHLLCGCQLADPITGFLMSPLNRSSHPPWS